MNFFNDVDDYHRRDKQIRISERAKRPVGILNMAVIGGGTTNESQEGTGKGSERNAVERDAPEGAEKDHFGPEIRRQMNHLPPNMSIINNPVKETDVEAPKPNENVENRPYSTTITVL